MNSWYDDFSKIKLITFEMNVFLYAYNIKLFQLNDVARMRSCSCLFHNVIK